MDDDALDHRLAALKRELATLRPPLEVERGIAAAITRAQRASRGSNAGPDRRSRERWLAWPLAIAAALGLITWTLRAPEPGETAAPPAAAERVATDFIPVVPVTDIAQTRAAYVVSTQVPRTMLADFGFPVSPARAADTVAGELLVRGDGTVLAVRFLE